MLSFEITQAPSLMNNMAGSALKRLSAAVGYNMTCSSQEEVIKQLPGEESAGVNTESFQTIQKRTVSDIKPLVSTAPKAETSSSLDILKTATEQKENLPTAKVVKSTGAISHAKPLKSRGNISPRDKYRAENQVHIKQQRREIRRKIREGEVRRDSWSPDQVLKNRWAKMSERERRDLVEKIDLLVAKGTIKLCDWLVWNVPKLGIKAMYMMMAGEVPDYAADAMKMCDIARDLDKF